MRQLIPALLLLGGTIIATPAAAIGFGVNFTASSGDVENDFNDEFDNETREFGVVMDTNHGGPFQFRGNLNAVSGKLDDEFDYDGLAINGTFGFRISDVGGVRLWAGPAVDLQFLEFDDGTGDDIVGFGFGPVLGIDLAAGPTMRFSAEAGLKYRLLSIDDEFDDDLELTGGEGFFRLSLLFGEFGQHRRDRGHRRGY